jgi:cell division protein FtsL
MILFAGIILTALGGYGSYHFGRREKEEADRVADEKQQVLKDHIAQLQASTEQVSSRVELIYRAAKIKEEIWTPVEMKNVPAGVADYLLLLFQSDKGRVSGKVRIKGSEEVYTFSTTANNRIPVAVRNLWLAEKGQYKVPTILEFLISEKRDATASLSVYTQGWIDTRGREPH